MLSANLVVALLLGCGRSEPTGTHFSVASEAPAEGAAPTASAGTSAEDYQRQYEEIADREPDPQYLEAAVSQDMLSADAEAEAAAEAAAETAAAAEAADGEAPALVADGVGAPPQPGARPPVRRAPTGPMVRTAPNQPTKPESSTPSEPASAPSPTAAPDETPDGQDDWNTQGSDDVDRWSKDG